MQPTVMPSSDSRAIVILLSANPFSSPLGELVRGAGQGDTLIKPDFALAQLPQEIGCEIEEKNLHFAEVDFKPLYLGRVDLFAQQLAQIRKSCSGSVRLLLPGAWKALPSLRKEQFARMISEACGGAKTVLC